MITLPAQTNLGETHPSALQPAGCVIAAARTARLLRFIPVEETFPGKTRNENREDVERGRGYASAKRKRNYKPNERTL
jgi:hypothetical protein